MSERVREGETKSECAQAAEGDACVPGDLEAGSDAPLKPRVVFLLDVDNTLLDSDRIVRGFRDLLLRVLGAQGSAHYWRLFAVHRERLGYVDYLGALHQCRDAAVGIAPPSDGWLRIADFLLDYPFAERLYPGAMTLMGRLNQIGATVILTDGDMVVQPRKVRRSGLWDACAGRVQICIHKEAMLDEMQDRFPARHYVMFDDKPQVLAAMKQVLADRLSTVFIRQGHHAEEALRSRTSPRADFSVARIADLLRYDLHALGRLPAVGTLPTELADRPA